MSLHQAARTGDVAEIQRQLQAGTFVDARDAQGRTPLMLAAQSERETGEAMRVLLQAGADPNAMGGEVPQPLLAYAVGMGDPTRVELLLDAGAEVAHTQENGYTILIHAMYGRDIVRDERLLPLVELLIRRGAPVLGESDWGESALSVASHNTRFDVVERLLDAGAD